MQRLGNQVTIICLKDGALAEVSRSLALNTVVLGVAPPPSFPGGILQKPLEIFRFWKASRRLIPIVAETLRRHGAHVVHVVSPTLLSIAAASSQKIGAPCFWEMPNEIGNRYPFGLNRRLYQRVVRRYRVTPLADSAFTAGGLRGGGVQPIVFYHATDEALFDPAIPAAQRGNFGVPADVPLLGVFARLWKEKGQRRLIQALGVLGRESHDLHLLLVGGPLEGEHFDLIQADIARLKLNARVHFVPTSSNVAAMLAMCDVTANVRTDAEPFGLSIIESMLMRRPVLVHALGGPAETVIDGVTGWHMANMEQPTIVAGLSRMLADRRRWGEMGDSARERALNHFTARKLAEHYSRLLEPGPVRQN